LKVASYVPLHYGREYLKWAVEAVEPFVDRVLVMYSPQPSFGRGGGGCPDNEEQLRACCDGLGDKLIWESGSWGSEGDHRGHAVNRLAGYDIILPVDADEVWDREALQNCLTTAADSSAARFLVGGFIHFWRSFGWCCRDVWAPVRILKPRGAGDATIGGKVYHFGYAQSFQTVAYKWTVHGHQNELRPDWLQGIFGDPTRRRDLHPCVLDWWNAEAFDREALPDSLKSHPYYSLDLIP